MTSNQSLGQKEPQSRSNFTAHRPPGEGRSRQALFLQGDASTLTWSEWL